MGTVWHDIMFDRDGEEMFSIGVDWNVSHTDTVTTIAPIIYRWDKYETNNYGGTFDETLSPEPSGSTGSWSGIGYGNRNIQNTTQIDSFASRSYNRGSGTTITLTISWSSNTGTYNGSYFENSGGGSHDWTYSIPGLPTYAISYNPNGGSGSAYSEDKTHGEAYLIDPCNFTAPTNKEFEKWNTETNGSGTNYYPGQEYSYNRTLTLYAIWKDSGSKIKVNANNYWSSKWGFWFPSSTKFISAFNSGTKNFVFSDDNPYPENGVLAILNSADYNTDLFKVPYHNEDEIEFLGYWTGSQFSSDANQWQVYSPTQWIYGSTRDYAAKAVGDGTYFKTDVASISIDNANIYSISDIENENGYAIPVAGNKITGQMSLPKWNKAGSTETFHALWRKRNLKFYFDPDNGISSEIQVETIQKPGFPEANAKIPQEYVGTSFYKIPSSLTFKDNFTPPIGKYLTGDWETRPPGQNPVNEWIDYELTFGGYITDTTFYAIWQSFHHTIKASLNGQTYTAAVQGGEQYSATDFSSLVANFENNKPEGAVGFYGLYTKERIGGIRVINKDGSPNNNGVHFIDNKWAYRTEGEPEADLILYPHWVPDTNAKMNISSDPNNPQWRYGFIYINKNANNPNLAPDWEQVPEVTFIKN